MSDSGNTEPLARTQRGATASHEPRDDLRVEPGGVGASPGDRDDHRLGGTAREARPARADHDGDTERGDRDRPDPVAAAKDPDNRAKLLLATAALTLLNTLLLIGVLASVLNDPGREEVVVDGVACIVADGEGEDNVLYCQR